MSRLNDFFKKISNNKFSLLLVLVYAAIYLPSFFVLEIQKNVDRHVIHMTLDDYIPFCEYFIIPYLIWFVYMIASVIYSYFTDKINYVRSFFYMATGMTIFIIVSFIFPNCHELRPEVMPRNNIFSIAVSMLHETDTPSNLFPSIHVYNSIAAHISMINNKKVKKNRRICNLSLIICISIILSTIFLKQHSLFDVITALILAAIIYPFCFFEQPEETSETVTV
ncbi:MAG: phosphatase PAP2 family protein [Lachnospiraceae bacterium]|nr:phosphatase PAP2 family protein [Lachnospiraceae bacterium]